MFASKWAQRVWIVACWCRVAFLPTLMILFATWSSAAWAEVQAEVWATTQDLTKELTKNNFRVSAVGCHASVV
jgi:hypothetical protein